MDSTLASSAKNAKPLRLNPFASTGEIVDTAPPSGIVNTSPPDAVPDPATLPLLLGVLYPPVRKIHGVPSAQHLFVWCDFCCRPHRHVWKVGDTAQHPVHCEAACEDGPYRERGYLARPFSRREAREVNPSALLPPTLCGFLPTLHGTVNRQDMPLCVWCPACRRFHQHGINLLRDSAHWGRWAMADCAYGPFLASGYIIRPYRAAELKRMGLSLIRLPKLEPVE
ncbi:MAG TPA: hypothetical protein VH253_17025 [Phycisphaerae bacterium]|nr:hypothetical protein [Phycisphaerae bacterium]